MIKVLAAVLSVSYLMTGSVNAAEFTFEDKDRTIELIGVVTNNAIDLAQKIDELSLENNRPIYFLVNSPGGSVLPGMILVDSMRQAQLRGVKFKCLTGVLAASMAFIVMAQCDERYAFPDAKLLFHPMSIGVDGARVQELYTDLRQTIILEKRMMDMQRSRLGMDKDEFLRNYWAETFWSGVELRDATNGFLNIVTRVNKAGPNLFRYRQPTMFLFGKQIKVPSPAQRIIERFESLGR